MDITALEIIYPLLGGLLLDLLLGDPRWLPHPVRWMGSAIALGEKTLNHGKHRFLKGCILSITLVALYWGILHGVFLLTGPYPVLSSVLATIGVFYGIANRNLVEEVLKVEKALTAGGLERGRRQLGFIVGRDTQNLTAHQVRVASLETLSENLSDGVITPLFYFMLGGVPAMFAYKMVNTLDSMIGYKNQRFAQFGKFAAKTDDLLNFLPARITALLMVLVSLSARGLKFVLKYGHQHASPNSGYPEAALAGILNCRFGGPNVYHGKLVDKPFIGDTDCAVTTAMVKKACVLNMAVTMTFILITLAFFIWV